MSFADIALCILILIGAIAGYREGFLMELFSFIGLVLGILGAFKLMGWAMIFLSDQFNVDKKVLPYIAFAVVFVLIVVLVRLLGNVLKLSIDRSFLGRLDQVAGAFLGIFKTAFLVSVALWIIDALKYNLPAKWTEDSFVLPRVVGFAPMITSWIAEVFPIFNDLF